MQARTIAARVAFGSVMNSSTARSTSREASERAKMVAEGSMGATGAYAVPSALATIVDAGSGRNSSIDASRIASSSSFARTQF